MTGTNVKEFNKGANALQGKVFQRATVDVMQKFALRGIGKENGAGNEM